jgi:trehalose 6-phosphate synthase
VECDDTTSRALKDWQATQGSSFIPVSLTPKEVDCYYRGFSNEILWPLLHSLASRCQFDSAYWHHYVSANEKFADAVFHTVQDNDFVWVHDYHLMILADRLRRRGLRQQLAYFHHVPFPSPDIFEALPWRVEILQSLLSYDLLGFQTLHDRSNFVSCLRRCLRDFRVIRTDDSLVIRARGRHVIVGAFPISIDHDMVAAEASRPQTVDLVNTIKNGISGSQIILGVDRLDYTKGIPERLSAFKSFLEENPEWRERVTMVQFVIPSRDDIPEYKNLQREIETSVSRINGCYSTSRWVPIHYFYRHIPIHELVAFYRASDIAMVTPLRDGMNLIAKEFCAARVDNRGVLMLSEFAGAADELKCGALLVNPHNSLQMTQMLGRALRMHPSEQGTRMNKMRLRVRQHDVFHWFQRVIAQNPIWRVGEITTAESLVLMGS